MKFWLLELCLCAHTQLIRRVKYEIELNMSLKSFQINNITTLDKGQILIKPNTFWLYLEYKRSGRKCSVNKFKGWTSLKLLSVCFILSRFVKICGQPDTEVYCFSKERFITMGWEKKWKGLTEMSERSERC